MNSEKQTVVAGPLTTTELDIVVESLMRVASLLNVSIDVTKHEPMYRQIVLSGSFWDVTTITNLMQDFKVV
jgi:hypothetical protein